MSFQASIQVRETRNNRVCFRFDRTMNGMMNTRTVRRDNYQTIQHVSKYFRVRRYRNETNLFHRSDNLDSIFLTGQIVILGQLGNFNFEYFFTRDNFFLSFNFSSRNCRISIVLNNSKSGFRKIISRIFLHTHIYIYIRIEIFHARRFNQFAEHERTRIAPPFIEGSGIYA